MEMAVKLNQPFNILYDMDFMTFSIMLGILKKKIDEKNQGNETMSQPVYFDTSKPVKLDVPDHLKLK